VGHDSADLVLLQKSLWDMELHIPELLMCVYVGKAWVLQWGSTF